MVFIIQWCIFCELIAINGVALFAYYVKPTITNVFIRNLYEVNKRSNFGIGWNQHVEKLSLYKFRLHLKEVFLRCMCMTKRAYKN